MHLLNVVQESEKGPPACGSGDAGEFHMQTLMIHQLGFDQNYYTLTFILLIKIVLCSKFP